MWAFTKYMSEEVLKWIGVIRVVLRSAGALMYIEHLTTSTEKSAFRREEDRNHVISMLSICSEKWHEAYILTKSAKHMPKQ